MKQRMLITGLSGLLGNNLAYCFKDTYEVLGVYHSHHIDMEGIKSVSADLSSGQGIAKIIKDFRPHIVIHCAAQANVDFCEENPMEAEKINVLATKYLVQSLEDSTQFIYISTDLVYDGFKAQVSEDAPTNPVNVYGQTKLQGEKEALKHPRTLVARTNFFGWNVLEGKYSIGEWVIHELKKKNQIEGFKDCQFSSIYTFELAKLLNLSIQRDLSGVYNFVSSTSLTKYDFLLQIAQKAGLNYELIKPISVDEFGLKAKRSKNLNLDVSKLSRALSIQIPTIEHSINEFILDFKKGLSETIRLCLRKKMFYPNSLNIIPYGRQSIDDMDILAVEEVLKSDTITQGARVHEFEMALCSATDASYAVAVNSGTAALHIACIAAGIRQGDEVITTPNTFVASANCVLYCGAKPIFADIDPKTYNINPFEIEKRINERTKAIIPVHFAGQSCDMEAIKNVVQVAERKYGHKIFIIEDASHALGSFYKGRKVGACVYSDMTTMSFHPVKHITTGEGGAVLTKKEDLYKTLKKLRSHGITNDDLELSQNRPGPWYYEQQILGYHYRITDILCALGISQIKKLKQFAKRRREIVNQYNEAFKDISNITIPYEQDFCDSNFHLYVFRLDFQKIGVSRSYFMSDLKKQGIQTQVHYIPVHTQPYYRTTLGTNWGQYPVAEHYYEQCLSIPLHPQLTSHEIDKVILNIKKQIKI